MLGSQLDEKKEPMKKKTSRKKPEMLSEYDFQGGVRGKYARRYSHSNNIVVIAQDVAKYFSDSESVNEALRTLLRLKKSGSRAQA